MPTSPAASTPVLFDLDGVLVDSRLAIATCMNRSLVDNGLEARPDAELHALIGPPTHAGFSTLVPLGADPGLVQRLVDSYRHWYGPLSLELTEISPGIPEAVAELAAKRRLAVATSKPKVLAVPLLERLGLASYFELISGPSLDSLNESKAETMARALEALGVEPEAWAYCAMIGDTRFDMIGARAHGMVAVGATWGIGSEAELTDNGADHLVHHPRELIPLLG